MSWLMDIEANNRPLRLPLSNNLVVDVFAIFVSTAEAMALSIDAFSQPLCL